MTNLSPTLWLPARRLSEHAPRPNTSPSVYLGGACPRLADDAGLGCHHASDAVEELILGVHLAHAHARRARDVGGAGPLQPLQHSHLAAVSEGRLELGGAHLEVAPHQRPEPAREVLAQHIMPPPRVQRPVEAARAVE